RVVFLVPLVPVEGNALGHFVRLAVDLHRQPELIEERHHPAIEARDRLRLEAQRARSSIARGDAQLLFDEIEVDLKSARAMRYRRSGEATRGDVERDMPLMIDPRRLHEAYFAYDLQPQAQCFKCIFPVGVRQRGPSVHAPRLLDIRYPWRHASETESWQGGAGNLQSRRGARDASKRRRRAAPVPSIETARVANQRLRLLHRHAREGSAR